MQAMRSMVPRLSDCLQTSRKYFPQFCISQQAGGLGRDRASQHWGQGQDLSGPVEEDLAERDQDEEKCSCREVPGVEVVLQL